MTNTSGPPTASNLGDRPTTEQSSSALGATPVVPQPTSATGEQGESRSKKRKFGDTGLPEHRRLAFLNAINAGLEEDLEAPWNKKDVGNLSGLQLLSPVNKEVVVFAAPPKWFEPHTLETSTKQAKINWYAETPAPGNKNRHLKYVAKVRADQESVMALAATILSKAKDANHGVIHLEFETVSQQLSIARRNHLAAPSAPEAIAANTCPNCGEKGHPLKDCAKPDPDFGSIKGCPQCNTMEHHLDHCAIIAARDKNDKSFWLEMMKLLLIDRKNKPQFRSQTYMAFEVFKVHMQLEHGEEILTTKDPNMVKAVTQTNVWPWSNKFAQDIATAVPGDRIMNAKIHPMQFKHGVHTFQDLPEDPALQGQSTVQVAQRVHNGEFNVERFLPNRELHRGFQEAQQQSAIMQIRHEPTENHSDMSGVPTHVIENPIHPAPGGITMHNRWITKSSASFVLDDDTDNSEIRYTPQDMVQREKDGYNVHNRSLELPSRPKPEEKPKRTWKELLAAARKAGKKRPALPTNPQ
ncbi:hypothetical protein QBC44DRAFT_401104 [Cladorrhinum sp. PSN332]|nr:hypothetical protein QBC44DRAFT_401104 [Cladorrhinum sp. PSN332]